MYTPLDQKNLEEKRDGTPYSWMNDTPRFGMRTMFIASLVLLVVGFFAGTQIAGFSFTAPTTAVDSTVAPDQADISALFEAWRILDENFAPATTTESLTAEEKIWGAIQGLTRAYGDPYTVFLPPAEKTIFETSIQGDFEGVGMEIGIRDEVLIVIAPLKDTPAYHAGLQSGDRILKIDDMDTFGITIEKAVGLIRGKRGTEIVLTIGRDEEAPFDVTIIRDTIALPTIDTEFRNDAVFVIQIYSFNALAPNLFREAIAEFADTGTNKLVIDLRGNPGGFLEVAVDMASWFLPVGKPIVIEDFTSQEERVYRSYGYNVFTDQLKLAILIDEGSASASEIFAGALHDYGIAKLVGQTSFGKGSVQQLFDVTEDSSLKVTIARWLTPNRMSISASGITPDIEVAYTKEDREAESDPQLEAAVEYLINL